ncbi:MAG: hypothetical protein QXM31_03045 [Candidatus Woesearchaeota archaeon]
MSLTADEKKFLRFFVQKELEHYKRDRKTMLVDLPVSFLKGGHDYTHFLEDLLKKLD